MRSLTVVVMAMVLAMMLSLDVVAELELNRLAIPIPSDAELVEEEVGKVASHIVILGALEKVNHELKPESSINVRGTKSSYTYYLPGARKTQDVVDEISGALVTVGQIAYQCSSRTCGSSSYWAKELDRSVLYGPEQFQQYLVVEIDEGMGYVIVYVGQRATRKIYLHIERVDKINE